MQLDIRLPMGLLFALEGLIILLYGLTHSNPTLYAKSDYININLWWGLVITVFGLFLLLMAWNKMRYEKMK